MSALKSATDPRRTVGALSKRPPEERDGRSAPRGPGAGRPKKDGSPPTSLPPELRALVGRSGKLPKAWLDGPPSAEAMAAFVAKHGSEKPDGLLNPMEAYEEAIRPILPFDIDAAFRVCDMIRAGHHPVWLKREWLGWPGDRTWMSWRTHEDVKAYYRQCLEDRSERSAFAAQDEIDRAADVVLTGKVDAKAAVAYVSAVHRRAEHARNMAAMHAPEKYGEKLQVNSHGELAVQIGLSGSAQRLIDEVRATKRIASPVIEGEVVR